MSQSSPFNLGRARPGSPLSTVGEDQRDDAFGAGGITREVPRGKVLAGRVLEKIDPRKYNYDVYAGRKANLPFSATKDDRMSADEAGAMMNRIRKTMGVDTADPEILFAFDRGLFFCHTLNGASTLTPGRATWSVPGYTTDFEYSVVRDMLGVDIRRFFRAYADDITRANKHILQNYDPNDITSSELHSQLIAVAAARGISRHPELCHDSAGACLDLNPTERQAVQRSAEQSISSTGNAADRRPGQGLVLSADKYDSTNGLTI